MSARNSNTPSSLLSDDLALGSRSSGDAVPLRVRANGRDFGGSLSPVKGSDQGRGDYSGRNRDDRNDDRDEDRGGSVMPPAPANPLVGSINLTPTGTSGEQYQTEISAYVSLGGKLFLLSSGGGDTLQVTTVSDTGGLALVKRESYGSFISTSVAAYKDLVAVALVSSNYDTTPSKGVVRFFRMGADGNLTRLQDVTVGYLPDGIAFSEDGRQLVIANEGQPSSNYGIDPIGSVGIIDIKYPTKTPSFSYTDLSFEGIKLPAGVRISGPAGTTQEQDIEPEYVSILDGKAYVTLQENNAVAVVDLRSRRIVEVQALGSVDFSKQAVDLSDKDGTAGASAFLPKLGQPFFGLRMADGISAFEVKDRTYYITANEGDAREYGSYVDVTRNAAAPNGRLNTIVDPAPSGPNTNTAIGSRSLSIFDAKTGALVWDSGNTLQTIAFAAGTYADNRSDDKGVEVESVITTKVDGRTLAIASLERGTKTTIVVFDVSKPAKTSYVSHLVIDGSVSPEGLVVIPAEDSPTGRALLAVSNEVSNTINLVDLLGLIDSPGVGSAGFFQPTMLKDVAGGPALQVSSLITNGEFTNGLNPGDSVYAPAGIFDGLGAFDNKDGTYTVLANSELGNAAGVPYLVDGVALTGARISKFIIDKDIDNDASNGYQSAVISGGIAYSSIVDANGNRVTNSAQINGGFSRFCSGSFEAANKFGKERGFVDSIYLTGEETTNGLIYALDTKTDTLIALAGLGKAGWETAIQVDTGSRNTVGLLLMDDNTAPIYLWVGEKSDSERADFLQHNGLAKEQGNLYTWVPTGGSIGTAAGTVGVPDSADLNALALGIAAAGRWALVGSGNQVAGWDQPTLRANANALGALQLSRLEDANINPLNGQQVVFATTGNSAFGGADTFGNLITLDLSHAFNSQGLIGSTNSTNLKVIYDGDREITRWDAANGNNNGVIDTAERGAFGATIIRNPDNLTWSKDGFIYVQEDRSVDKGFFQAEEASVFKVSATAKDSVTGQAVTERWLQIDRAAVPSVYGQSDSAPTDYGNWESSGIIDVSAIYGEAAGSMLLGDVQAHSLGDNSVSKTGNIGGSGYLVEGGQLNLIQNPALF